jgi:hypothetical protein
VQPWGVHERSPGPGGIVKPAISPLASRPAGRTASGYSTSWVWKEGFRLLFFFAALALSASATFLRKALRSNNCCLRMSTKTTRSRDCSAEAERGDLSIVIPPLFRRVSRARIAAICDKFCSMQLIDAANLSQADGPHVSPIGDGFLSVRGCEKPDPK